jgi:hypothetical protein
LGFISPRCENFHNEYTKVPEEGQALPGRDSEKRKTAKITKIFLKNLGAFPALRAGNRAIRLYLFCHRQKRIPLLSLARKKKNCHRGVT